MNNHIIVNVQPFVMQQEIQVFKNGACVKVVESKMDSLEENIAITAKLHNITNIGLAGDKNFTRRIKQRLGQNKFNMDLNIKLY